MFFINTCQCVHNMVDNNDKYNTQANMDRQTDALTYTLPPLWQLAKQDQILIFLL